MELDHQNATKRHLFKIFELFLDFKRLKGLAQVRTEEGSVTCRWLTSLNNYLWLY